MFKSYTLFVFKLKPKPPPVLAAYGAPVSWMELHLARVEDSREDGGDAEIVVALLAHC